MIQLLPPHELSCARATFKDDGGGPAAAGGGGGGRGALVEALDDGEGVLRGLLQRGCGSMQAHACCSHVQASRGVTVAQPQHLVRARDGADGGGEGGGLRALGAAERLLVGHWTDGGGCGLWGVGVRVGVREREGGGMGTRTSATFIALLLMWEPVTDMERTAGWLALAEVLST